MFENYKKNDPRFWWFYTKLGKVILLTILIAIVILVILDQLGIKL
tara:strand:+ start:3300 stop:3434 length:135 start_codon:yes stop_codon:yes gene_type:complete